LAQLSEQDRQKVEIELAELNRQGERLNRQRMQCQERISLLQRQQDHAMKNRNAASLLQSFALSLREQQALLVSLQASSETLEQEKEGLLKRFADIYRTGYAYDRMHDRQLRSMQRNVMRREQRDMDDRVAVRISMASSGAS